MSRGFCFSGLTDNYGASIFRYVPQMRVHLDNLVYRTCNMPQHGSDGIGGASNTNRQDRESRTARSGRSRWGARMYELWSRMLDCRASL